MEIHLLGPQLLCFIVARRGDVAIAVRVTVHGRIGGGAQLTHTAIGPEQRQLRRGEKIRVT